MIDLLTTIVLACTDYPDGVNVSNTLDAAGGPKVIDAVNCVYAEQLTLPIYAALVVVGVFNLPIYIKQDSVLIPFVITLAIGGVVIQSISGIVVQIAVLLIMFTIGIGPVLLLRRIQQP